MLVGSLTPFVQPKNRIFAIAVAALLIWHLVRLAMMLDPVASASDSAGYLNEARALSEGRLQFEIRELAELELPVEHASGFISLGMTHGVRPGDSVHSYPPGLPLMLAAIGWIGGLDRLAVWIVPVVSLLGCACLFFLGKEIGLSRWAALTSAVMLACCPSYYLFSITIMSDSVATALVTASVWLAWRSKNHSSSAWLAGIMFGVSVLVRPTNLLLLPPVLIALPWNWRCWMRFVLGGLPLAALFAANNSLSFGSPFATGYGSIGALMKWSYFPSRSAHYAGELFYQLTPMALPGWLALPWIRQIPLRVRWLLVVWPIPCFVFYFFYECYDTWWYLRFLLPGVPGVILGCLFALQAFVARVPERSKTALRAGLVALFFLVVFLQTDYSKRRGVRLIRGSDQANYVESLNLASRHFSPEAYMICMQTSGAIRYYTDFRIIRWDIVFAAHQPLLRDRLIEKKIELGAVLFDFEEEAARVKFPGRWTKIETVLNVTVWKVELK